VIAGMRHLAVFLAACLTVGAVLGCKQQTQKETAEQASFRRFKNALLSKEGMRTTSGTMFAREVVIEGDTLMATDLKIVPESSDATSRGTMSRPLTLRSFTAARARYRHVGDKLEITMTKVELRSTGAVQTEEENTMVVPWKTFIGNLPQSGQ
jgi:hypothetical protein